MRPPEKAKSQPVVARAPSKGPQRFGGAHFMKALAEDRATADRKAGRLGRLPVPQSASIVEVTKLLADPGAYNYSGKIRVNTEEKVPVDNLQPLAAGQDIGDRLGELKLDGDGQVKVCVDRLGRNWVIIDGRYLDSDGKVGLIVTPRSNDDLMMAPLPDPNGVAQEQHGKIENALAPAEPQSLQSALGVGVNRNEFGQLLNKPLAVQDFSGLTRALEHHTIELGVVDGLSGKTVPLLAERGVDASEPLFIKPNPSTGQEGVVISAGRSTMMVSSFPVGAFYIKAVNRRN